MNQIIASFIFLFSKRENMLKLILDKYQFKFWVKHSLLWQRR